MVIERLREAARVLRSLPCQRWPSQRVTVQVDVVRSFWEAYGTELARVAKVLPSGSAIDRADEALQWLPLLTAAEDRLLVWARAHDVKWRHLERRFGMTERHLRRMHRAAISRIVLTLNS